MFSRLADRGEEVLSKFAETPGAARVVELINSTRERLDDLQKRVMGLENLERKLDQLEKRVEQLEGGETKPAPKPASKPAPPKKPEAEKKPTGS